MRRRFLFQTIAAGFSMLFGSRAVKSASLNLTQDSRDSNWIAGKWSLLKENDDEVNISQYRMYLVIKVENGRLKAAFVDRIKGEEFPLSDVKFDGSTLQLQMRPPIFQYQTTLTTLVMTLTGEKFEGTWVKSDTGETGPTFKLIKMRA